MKNSNVKRYIPVLVNKFLQNRIHIHFNHKDLFETKVYNLDIEGLIIIVDTILRIGGSRDINKDNFVEIKSTDFHKILQNDYSLYLNYLLENKIVYSDNFYIKGEKSISYKINEDYLNDDIISFIIDNKLFNKRTIKAINETSNLKITTKHRNNYFKTFKLDFDNAIAYMSNCFLNQTPDHKGRVLNKYTKTLLQVKLNIINDGGLWINRSSTNGRINSNLTTLNGNYKQFIVGYDESLDIVSSQPVLLNVLIDLIESLNGKGKSGSRLSSLSSLLSYEYKILEKVVGKSMVVRVISELKNVKTPEKNELKKYRELCESGELYEYFQKQIELKTGTKMTREEVKQIVITMLYSSIHTPSEYKKLFSVVFPSIYNFINKMKNLVNIPRKHRLLSIIMQGIESFIWCDNILPSLDKMNIPYLFIHDSVLVKQGDSDRAEMKIMEEFFNININPKIKKEKL